jgi:hypothetical protein
MPLSVQPLANPGTISGVATMPNPAPISVAPPQTQQPISVQQPAEQHLDYIKNSPNQPDSQATVAPLPEDVKATMVSKLTAARQQFPGQDDQILQQFIQQNKAKYPVQIGKLEKTINYGQDTKGDSNSSLTMYNNPMGLKDPTTGQFERFSDPQAGFQAGLQDLQNKVSGASRTGTSSQSTLLDLSKAWAGTGSNNVTSWAQAVADKLGVPVTTPIGQIDLTQLANAVASHETGYTPTTSYDPSSVLDELIKQNQPQAPTPPIAQPPAAWDSGGILTGSTGLVHNISNDFQNIQQSENQNVANQQAGKEGPVAGLIQELGAGAQGLNSVVGEGLKSVFRSVAPQPVQQGVAAIGNNSTVQKVLGTASGFLSKESAQHPVGMANASAITNIALALAPFLPGGEEANAVEKTQGAYEDALGATKSGVQTGSKIAARSGESPAEFLANAGIPPETDVVNGRRIFTTGPDSQTYATIQQRTSALTNLRDDALSTIKSPSSVEDLRQTALSQAKTQFVGKEYQQVVDHINSEFDAFKTQPGVSEDTIPSVNNIKKYFQGNAGYDATRPSTITEANRMVANIAKTQVETDAEAAGVPGIQELNKTIQQHLDFLDDGNKKGILSKLNGQVIKGGKIGTYTKEIIGAGVGGAVGHFLGGGLLGEALGGLGGAKAGDLVSSFMQSLAAGGSGTAGILGKIATENPQVVQQFLDYLGRSGESVAPIVKPALSIGSLPKTLLSGSAGLIQNLSPKN